MRGSSHAIPYSAISPRRANDVVSFAADRGDHRLAHAVGDVARAPGLARDRTGPAVADLREILHVGPGAEAATGAGDHDRTDLGVVLGLVEQPEVLSLERRVPGVEAVGAVECDQRHRAAALGEDRRVGRRVGGHDQDPGAK
jgi:hypothetical protein